MGFEPMVPFGTPVYQTGSLSRSDTLGDRPAKGGLQGRHNNYTGPRFDVEAKLHELTWCHSFAQLLKTSALRCWATTRRSHGHGNLHRSILATGRIHQFYQYRLS